MKKYLVEFIGTYFLVLTIGLSIANNLGLFTPLAIGAGLMVLVYAGGHISGAHYNPAVTVAVCLRGSCSWADAPGYIAAQLIGAGFGAWTLYYFSGNFTEPIPLLTGPAFIAEILGTFALVWVILNVATSINNAGNSFYGLAIGAAVTALIYLFGDISGAAFNPAVAVGAGMMNFLDFADIWIHISGSLIGAILACYIFLYVNGRELLDSNH